MGKAIRLQLYNRWFEAILELWEGKCGMKKNLAEGVWLGPLATFP